MLMLEIFFKIEIVSSVFSYTPVYITRLVVVMLHDKNIVSFHIWKWELAETLWVINILQIVGPNAIGN